MKYKLYESYGALAHERRPIYSDTIPATEHYNAITAEIPYTLSENTMGETLIDINDETYLLSDVLANFGDAPCITWHDGQHQHRVMLEIVK